MQQNKYNASSLPISKIKAEMSVYGYIRRHYRHFNEFPLELLQLCLQLYFMAMDSWNALKSHNRFTFQDGLATVSAGLSHPNAFGNLLLSKGDMMEWKFEICGPFPEATMIGIIDSDKAKPSMGHYFASYKNENHGMAYFCYDGKKCSSKCRQSDYVDESIRAQVVAKHNKIIMILDMTGDKGLLSFKTGKDSDNLDDFIDHGVAFDDIDVSKTYCMAVSMLLQWRNLRTVKLVEDF